MAMTKGAKKVGVTLLIAALLGGGWYMGDKKGLFKAKPVAPVEQVNPADKSVYTPPADVAPAVKEEAPKEAKKAIEKKRHAKASASVKKHSAINEPTHNTLKKEISDQDAIKALSGGSL